MPTNDELIQSLRAALELSPEALPLRRHLADLLLAGGAFAEAVEEYRRALDLAPEDRQIKLALAEAYCRQAKADVALVILEELMRLPDPAPQAFLLAARAYLALDKPEQAARAYRQALARQPGLADGELEKQLPPERVEEAEAVRPADKPLFAAVEEPEGKTPLDLERPRITFQDVGGMDKLKEQIRLKIIYPITKPDIYKVYGKAMGGGILMYGPPGCGKTYLARATAGEVKAHFLAVGLHDVLDMWLGKSEQNLHAIFDLARTSPPCVLFFDEVDALGASRSDMRHHGIRHVINQFLSELDGVQSSNEGVLILAATNMPWYIDSALRRPGRFDRVIFVPPPDAPARVAILQLMLADKPTHQIDYEKLARATADFSGADLRGVVDQAVEHKLHDAMQTGLPKPLTSGDLAAVIKTVHPTTKEWFETARNYATYSNVGGAYDDVLEYLKRSGKGL
ncbi:MAG: AAA family ATPase [Thermoflexales bacterium]|nr:AAA family ATPase [Thermoflexales bacterium]